MKDRLSKISKKATYAFCLLAVCGLTYSCADEYKLDDEAPAWLGKSIYDELKGRDGFDTMINLIDDLGEKETLSKTGSRTLFASSDDAFASFFKQNETNPINKDWSNATSYDKLTDQQKRMLLNAATLNNAYLMEMLPSAQGNPPTKGVNMRKETLLGSINIVQKATEFPVFKDTTLTDYWKDFRGGTEPLYMISDNTTPMLVFFTPEQMSKANIQNEDVEYIMGLPKGSKSPNDSYVYGNRVVEKDITCQNGYIHILDKVLLPPGNMAEVIRTNGNTNIFSHILERFSAPYYNATITQNYQDVYGGNQKIYVKKYFSNNTGTATASEGFDETFTTQGEDGYVLSVGPDKENPSTNSGTLKFDPGWNQFVASGSTSTSDMAAMFVPNDAAMMKYFTEGTGRELINKYGDPSLDMENNIQNLYDNIDRIPMGTINALVNNLMQSSFVNSVPSKFNKVLNTAMDNLFPSDANPANIIDTAFVANNGVVYLMNEVYAPVDYESVASPAFLSNNDFDIMKFAIFSGSRDYRSGNDKMGGIHFYAYLRALKSKFTVFLPTDDAMKYYVDPLFYGFYYQSQGATTPRILDFSFDATADMPVNFMAYAYYNGQKGVKYPGTQSPTNAEIANRLEDILETHTIVHSIDEYENGIYTHPDKQYYLTKSGAPVKITKKDKGNPSQLCIQGAMQIVNDSETEGSRDNTKVRGFYQSEVDPKYSSAIADIEKKNGWTFCVSAPIATSVKSVYRVLRENGDTEEKPFYQFFELCDGFDEQLLVDCGILKDATTDRDKYATFMSGGLDGNNVSFFSNYNYTVYVPTNEAIKNAIEKDSLPTWDSIKEYIEQHESDNDWESSKKYIAQEQIYCLINFIRGHFQDNSIFCDYLKKDSTDYETATLDEVTNKFVKLNVRQMYSVSEPKIIITSANGDECVVDNTVDEKYKNLMTRDYTTKADFSGLNYYGNTIDASSYAVVHQIKGGVLSFTDLSSYNGNYMKYCRSKAAKSAKNLTSKIRVRNK